MTFLPIVGRELRVASRHRSTYWIRLLVALGAIGIGGWIMVMTIREVQQHLGITLFVSLSILTFIYSLLAGVLKTADCLSEEKRAGTLGLLFLTDLRGYDVTLGKLLATSLRSFYGLLAVFPPLGIPLVLGGVTVGEFWRMVLALIVTLLFALTAGLLVSSMSRDERRAWSGTVALTGFFVVLVPLLQGIIALPISPTCAFLGWTDARYSSSAGDYWTAVWSSLALSAGFVVAASLLLPRAWQEQPETARRAWLFGAARQDTPSERATRRRLLEVNPVVWLAARSARQSFLVWGMIVAGSAVAMAVWFVTEGARPGSIGVLAVFILVHLVLSIWAASEACAVFPAARDTGALELLLSTPLTLREIVDGHLLGLTRLVQRPLLVLLAADGAFLAAYLLRGAAHGWPAKDVLIPLIGVGACMAVSVMDLFAVTRYGMWAGLNSGKTGWAVSKTILLVLVLPMVAGTCCGGLWAAWPVFGIIKNLIIISYSQEQLRRHFRRVVTERYGTRAGGETLPKPSRRRIESELPPVLPR